MHYNIESSSQEEPLLSAGEKSFLLKPGPSPGLLLKMRHFTLTGYESGPLFLSPGEFADLVDILNPIQEEEEEQVPSLMDLLDLEEEPEVLQAVNAVFPEELLTANPEELVCHEVLGESSEEEGEGPQHEDLGICLEEAPEMILNSDFVLDHPAVPGVDCMSCDYHRKRAELDGIIKCSLCYMRENSHCVYSKYSQFLY